MLLASGVWRVLLVLLMWGGCPHAAVAAQDGESRPPLLPATQAWEAQLPSRPSAGGAMDASRVYVPLADGAIVALDRATGSLAWTASSVGHSTPVVHDASVYVARDGALVALEAATGRERWTASLDTLADAPPVAAGGRIVVLTASGLTAVRVEDGQVLWTSPLGGPAAPATLAASAGRVFVVRGGVVTAIEASRGAVRWRRELPVAAGTPAVVGDRLLVGSAGDALLALEIDTGDLAWRWRLGGAVVGAAGGDGVLYVASLDAILRALRLGGGNQIWKRELSTRPVAPPVVAGDLIVLPGNAPVLGAFAAATGAPAAMHEEEGELVGPPLIAPGDDGVNIVLLLRDGRVVGLAELDENEDEDEDENEDENEKQGSGLGAGPEP